MLIASTQIVTPSLDPGKPGHIIDLEKIVGVETRIREVAFVTPHKAPELLACFNEAWRDLDGIIVKLEAEKLIAEREANKVRSVVLLDRAPDILQAKGLVTKSAPGGSEDYRKAVLDADPEYQAAQDIVREFVCLIALLRGKQESILMAFSSVKKILGERQQASNMGLPEANPHLRGEIPSGAEAGTVVQEAPKFRGFGKVRI